MKHGKCDIFIIDDESIVGDRLRSFLESDGHHVETSDDPRRALEILGDRRFDIVISDIRMGEIDGIHLLEEVRERAPQTKVIMITGYATLELAHASLAKGAFDFIAKPFKVKEIRASIAKAVKALG